MIGKKVSSMCLEDAELNFYQWDGELSELLGKVLSHPFISACVSTRPVNHCSDISCRRCVYPESHAGVSDTRSGDWCR